MEYYAHIRTNETNLRSYQTVMEHLRSTANQAVRCLSDCGYGKVAYLAGLLHDIGKYTHQFQEYLASGDQSLRGSVIHSFQGVRFILDQWHKTDDYVQLLTSELLAVAVGAHHGLFDCMDESGDSGLEYRQEKQGIGYDEAVKAFLEEISIDDLNLYFEDARKEIVNLLNRLDESYSEDDEYAFHLGLFARLILSAVIEGDRCDTASFMNGTVIPERIGDMSSVWAERLNRVELKLSDFPCITPVQKARREISQQCKDFAVKPQGIYRLNVPTGAGKTLSSLRFALAHAKEHNLKHIIFTSPLLSILEQNAGVIHDFVGNDNLILEHHSNVVHTENKDDCLNDKELWVQNWDAPIIITTLVQLLNTLFSGKTTSIRRFQSLCNSVIVIDEVQTVPTKLLSCFNMAIRFLHEQCGTTVVLCSATQPCLEQADHPLGAEPADIVPYNASLWSAFERTAIDTLPNTRLEGLPGLILDHMKHVNSLLVVCNRKDEAQFLLNATKSAEWTSFHLSASMCTQHRRDTVSALKQKLKDGNKVLCVSTQVIEAGVDVSFERVIRLLAGMDSVVQSAGRCNRNGESEKLCPVYMINCTDEKLGKLREILRGKQASERLILAMNKDKDRFSHDYSSNESIRFYYKAFYSSMNPNEQDCFIETIHTSLFDLLSLNTGFVTSEKGEEYALWQAFKTAGRYFSVFDENTTDVLVPYGNGVNIIRKLQSDFGLRNEAYRSAVLKSAVSYSVSLYDFQKKKLQEAGAIYAICDDSILILSDDYYDDVIGLTNHPHELSFLEV